MTEVKNISRPVGAEPFPPLLEVEVETELLCGNRAGFELLADAIGKLLKEEEDNVGLPGEHICFPAIQLWEDELQPPPEKSIVTGIICYAFLALLVSILGLAVFGACQLFHLILS